MTYADLRYYGLPCSQEDVGLCVAQSFFNEKLYCPVLRELIITADNTYPYVTPEHLPAVDAEIRSWLNPHDVSVSWEMGKEVNM